MVVKRYISYVLFWLALCITQNTHSAAGPQSLSNWWKSAQHKAAFVLPYYYNPQTRHTYYIFGQEKGGRDQGTYSPFGGKANQNEKHPLVTAARETYEELNSLQTMRLSNQAMQNHIDLRQNNTTAIIAKKKSQAKNATAMYITKFPEKKIKNELLKRFKGSSEIKYLAEVRDDRLKSALANAQPGHPIKVEATVWIHGFRQPNQTITLRPLTAMLKPWITGNKSMPGANHRIHFY